MIVIPNELVAARELADLEQWMLDRYRDSPHTMRDELDARSALETERFVRKNVSREKFLTWIQENPRRFTTEREMQHVRRNAMLDPPSPPDQKRLQYNLGPLTKKS